jgi:hypothetical protein
VFQKKTGHFQALCERYVSGTEKDIRLLPSNKGFTDLPYITQYIVTRGNVYLREKIAVISYFFHP